jgi:DNA-binding NarL/FixJ family response regulator
VRSQGYLTPRESEVLELVARGLDNGTIGVRLGISERTVRNYVSTIFSTLGVKTRAQVIVRARDVGFGKLTS